MFSDPCSGLGYISGASIASLTGDWRWALRVSKPLSFFLKVVLPPRVMNDFFMCLLSDHSHTGCRWTTFACLLVSKPTERCCGHPRPGNY